MFNRDIYGSVRHLIGIVAAGILISFCGIAAFAQSERSDGKLESSHAKSEKERFETPFAAFRLGLGVSPNLAAQVGLDVTFPRFSLGRSWVTRFDFEAQALLTSPSFGSRRDSVFSFNLCQIYSPGGANRSKFYIGGGIGAFYGPFSGTIGGKFFLGSNVSDNVAFELQTLFPGGNSPQVVLGIRLSAF